METNKELNKNINEKFEYLDEIGKKLEKKLPEWAGGIIANIDPEDTLNISQDELNQLPSEVLKKLVEEADGINAIFSLLNFMPEEHETDWHQFGIIDHSIITVEWLKSIIEKYPVLLKLHNKEIVKNINNHFQEKIGDKTKKDLFILSGYLHDIGKFATRKIEINKDGSVKHKKNGELKFSFKDHEKKSGEILEKNQNIRNDLMDMGLTEDQIDYLAQCSKLHFELGILRNVAKTWQSENSRQKGFCPEFVNSPEFYDGALDIISKHPKYTTEIGIFYLADTLSKHRLENKDPDIIEQYLEKLIKEEKLQEYQQRVLKPVGINNDNILEGIKQIPINIAAARKYFDICANDFERQTMSDSNS